MTSKGVNRYRYERKFVVRGFDCRHVESLVKLHPAIFRETYPPRWVNNIYLDTHSLHHFSDHVDGSFLRCKVRIRWYGTLLGRIEKPVLEWKIRRGLVGYKQHYPLEAFDIDGAISQTRITALANQQGLPPKVRETLRILRPTMANRYARKYLGTIDNSFRVTIDSEMAFVEPRTCDTRLSNQQLAHDNTVVELKYSTRAVGRTPTVIREFPFCLSKFSKYVYGVQLLRRGCP